MRTIPITNLTQICVHGEWVGQGPKEHPGPPRQIPNYRCGCCNRLQGGINITLYTTMCLFTLYLTKGAFSWRPLNHHQIFPRIFNMRQEVMRGAGWARRANLRHLYGWRWTSQVPAGWVRGGRNPRTKHSTQRSHRTDESKSAEWRVRRARGLGTPFTSSPLPSTRCAPSAVVR